MDLCITIQAMTLEDTLETIIYISCCEVALIRGSLELTMDLAFVEVHIHNIVS